MQLIMVNYLSFAAHSGLTPENVNKSALQCMKTTENTLQTAPLVPKSRKLTPAVLSLTHSFLIFFLQALILKTTSNRRVVVQAVPPLKQSL